MVWFHGEVLVAALHQLGTMLKEEVSVSAYELHTSGGIQSLLSLLASHVKVDFWFLNIFFD